MADSIEVLSVLKIVYTIYAWIAISIIARFGLAITKSKKKEKSPSSKLFWAYVSILVVIGTGLHFLTYGVVPWVSVDLNRSDITAHKQFEIIYENHKMTFSENPMQVDWDKPVIFNAISNDLVYGFGIFRQNHTLVTQMQVVPQSRNDLMWKFHKNGTYHVRSTEYSGPKGAHMLEKNVVVVTGCAKDDTNS